jgi:hypothetical protein
MSSSKTTFAASILVLLVCSPPAVAHDFWINNSGYRSPTGEHCCGNHDCSAYAPAEVRVTPAGYALPTGELVPFSEAQKSEDGEYWRCKRNDGSRRCFFAPMPQS